MRSRTVCFILLIVIFIFSACVLADYLIKINTEINNKYQQMLNGLSPNIDHDEIILRLKMLHEYEKNHYVYDKIPVQYRNYIIRFCSQNDLPALLVYAYIQLESEWNNRCIGRNATSIDIGLGQINSRYMWVHAKAHFKSRDWKSFNIYNPYDNLEVSLNLMNELYKQFHYDYRSALAAYNAGYMSVIYKKIPQSTYRYIYRIENIMYNV